MHVLNCFPAVRCLDEPFNRDVHTDYPKRVTGSESLRATLDDLWREYNGIKHVNGPSGWPFSRRELNYALLRRDDYQIVFLTRRNILRRLVSVELAQQTGVWHFWTLDDRDTVRDFTYETLDVSSLRAKLRLDTRYLAECRRHLEARELQPYELDYERLFGSGVARHDQLQVVNEVAAFLGLEPLPAKRRAAVTELLDSGVSGSNSASLYRRVPNIDEVEEALGCDETGWLFKDTLKADGSPVAV